MAQVKGLGLDVEAHKWTFFAAVPLLGDVWVEAGAEVQGRWWFDCMAVNGNLLLYFGRTHAVISPVLTRLWVRQFAVA